MTEKFSARLVAILRPLFPQEAEIVPIESGDCVRLGIVWRLRTDPKRPNKRSRRIILQVSQEIVEDYLEGHHATCEQLERRIVHSVSDHLRTFDPHHDTPYGWPSPEETWTVLA